MQPVTGSEAPPASFSRSLAPSGAHDVFISYAHEDRDFVRGLAAALSARGFRVWWDAELRAGDQWAASIEAALERTKLAVIVVWSASSVRSNPVLCEADLAVRLKRYLPIRIDDSDPQLFFRLHQALDFRSATPRAYESLEAEIARRSRDPLRPGRTFFQPGPRIDWGYLVIRGASVVVMAATALFLLYGTGLADRIFETDTKMRDVSVLARRLVEPPKASNELTFVSIGEVTTEALGAFDGSYRSLFAELLPVLGRHGARTVAFDLYFPPPPAAGAKLRGGDSGPSEGDAGTAAFAAAIQTVRAQGTSVVVGERERWGTDPAVARALAGPGAGLGYIASLCVGLERMFAVSTPLLVATRDGEALRNPTLSLSLAAFAAQVGADARHPMLGANDCCIRLPSATELAPRMIRISEFGNLRHAQVEECPYLRPEADSVATLLVDFPRDPHYGPGNRNVVEFSALHELANRAERGASVAERNAASSELDRLLYGRLVLVGVRLPSKDIFPVAAGSGKYTWGSELHAFAIETLFENRALRLMSNAGHLVLIVVAAALGAFVRAFYRRDYRRRRVALAVLVALNVAGVFAAALLLNLLVDGVYQTCAIVLAYFLSGRFVSPFSPVPAARSAA